MIELCVQNVPAVPRSPKICKRRQMCSTKDTAISLKSQGEYGPVMESVY